MGRGARVFIPNTLAPLHAIGAIKDIGLCSTDGQWCREKVNFWLSCHEIWFAASVEWFRIGTTNVSPICFALPCPDSNIVIEQAPRCRQIGPGKVQNLSEEPCADPLHSRGFCHQKNLGAVVSSRSPAFYGWPSCGGPAFSCVA